MSRNNRLPNIPVKQASVRKVLTVSAALDAKLRAYIAYYAQQQGLDPKQAPRDVDTMVTLIETFLSRDVGFNRYLRQRSPASGSRESMALPTAASKQ